MTSVPYKIVRQDITKIHTEAVVNTANSEPTVGTGCDHAVYAAAGYEELLAYRKEHIGFVKEGDVFITPGFGLPARVIIHAVSPLYIDGKHQEEELLRSCYRKSLALAAENGIRSIAFPLISTGGFGYPREEGMRIAIDEISAFLSQSSMEIYLVVFDEESSRIGKNTYPGLEVYIDRHYVKEKQREEYGDACDFPFRIRPLSGRDSLFSTEFETEYERRGQGFTGPQKTEAEKRPEEGGPAAAPSAAASPKKRKERSRKVLFRKSGPEEKTSFPDVCPKGGISYSYSDNRFEEEEVELEKLKRGLAERMSHLEDNFSKYLLHLIQSKGMENAEVYRRAIIDKKVFSKIKNNPEYHPQKRTVLCLCIGAKLSLDESKDLLKRAGYALSPCDKTDVIFSYFIEYKIYDMIELDIQLEEHGLPCIIS